MVRLNNAAAQCLRFPLCSWHRNSNGIQSFFLFKFLFAGIQGNSNANNFYLFFFTFISPSLFLFLSHSRFIRQQQQQNNQPQRVVFFIQFAELWLWETKKQVKKGKEKENEFASWYAAVWDDKTTRLLIWDNDATSYSHIASMKEILVKRKPSKNCAKQRFFDGVHFYKTRSALNCNILHIIYTVQYILLHSSFACQWFESHSMQNIAIFNFFFYRTRTTLFYCATGCLTDHFAISEI